MTTSRRNNSDVVLNCVDAAKICASGCDTVCNFYPSESHPFGITIIPGSGKLTEFPATNENLNCPDDGSNFLELIL